MPNVTPRGLFARDAAGSPNEAQEIFIRSSGVWTSARWVYAWSEATRTWVVVWARDAGLPTAMTATWNNSPRTVTLSWTLPLVQTASTYNVYRPDGSLAGSVSAATTTFTDATPRAYQGSYYIKAVTGGIEASQRYNAPSLDLRLVVSAVNVALSPWNSPTWQITVTWSEGAVQIADGWRIYDPTGSLVGTVNRGAPLSFTYAAGTSHTSGRFRVEAFRVSSPPVSASSSYVDLSLRAATAVTVSYVESATAVNIYWTIPSPNTADGWVVYRPNGTRVPGINARSSTATTDYSPYPMQGSYVVRPVDAYGNISGAATSSPSLDLRLTPNLSLVAYPDDQAPSAINVFVTKNAVGYPDSYRIDRNKYGAWEYNWATLTPDGSGAASTSDYDVGRGDWMIYTATPVLSGVLGTGVQASIYARVLPPGWTSVTRTDNGNGTWDIAMAWTDARSSTNDVNSYDLEGYLSAEGKWFGIVYNYGSIGKTWTTASSSVYVRVRSRDRKNNLPGGWNQYGPI